MLQAIITPLEQPVCVVNGNDREKLHRYDCLTVNNHQVCFHAYIAGSDSERSWTNSSSTLGYYLTEYVPLAPFYGKHEGEIVNLDFFNKLTNENVTVQMTLKGCNGRTFEDILFERTMGFGGVYDPSDEEDVSRIKQYCMIVAAHQQYSDSIGRKSCDPETFRYSSCWIECLTEESKKSPKLNLIEKLINAMSDDTISKSPADRLAAALHKVQVEP
ncbi:Hypothetical protein HVR_LOCUS308 [uncultured virus]|nr:Hypothetical protein HVR_LOCUS308 [uncultured virus]